MHPLLGSIAHRPWALPRRPWVMEQTWHDLLFAHWPVRVERLRGLVPTELPLDTYRERAWVGVVPFWMSGIRGRFLPPLPGLSQFPELNVRTYVVRDGKPGVYFFSLDAASLPAVWTARATYRLPYFHARIRVEERDGRIHYASQRMQPPTPAIFRGVYRPVGETNGGSYTVALNPEYLCCFEGSC